MNIKTYYNIKYDYIVNCIISLFVINFSSFPIFMGWNRLGLFW